MAKRHREAHVLARVGVVAALASGAALVMVYGPPWCLRLRACYIREGRLRAEIAKLQIHVDHQNRASQVAQITDSLDFRNLQDGAKQLRSPHKDE